MIDIEQELQRSFDVVTSKLEIALNRDGLKVVDVSLFPQFSDYYKKLDEQLCREFESGFYEWWKERTDESVIYCDESITETLAFVDHLIIIADIAENQANRNHGITKIEAIEKSRSRNNEAIIVMDFLNEKMNDSVAEAYLPDSLGSDIEKPGLKNLCDCTREIAGIPGIIIDVNEKFKNRKTKRAFHSSNDPIIMAKFLGISYSQPITLLTRDIDFRRMFLELIRNKDMYSKRHGIEIPVGNLSIIEQYRTGLTIYHGNGEREKLSNLIDYELINSVRQRT